MRALWAPSDPAEIAPSEKTVLLQDVLNWTAQYVKANQAELSDADILALRELPDYQQTAAGLRFSAVDPWGRPLRYRLDVHPPKNPRARKPRPIGIETVWSLGPDGKDQNGQGDDIMISDRAIMRPIPRKAG
jgi:hypothetical protein